MPERSEPEGLGLAGERAVVKFEDQARKRLSGYMN